MYEYCKDKDHTCQADKATVSSLGSLYVSGENAYLPLSKPNINTYFSL